MKKNLLKFGAALIFAATFLMNLNEDESGSMVLISQVSASISNETTAGGWKAVHGECWKNGGDGYFYYAGQTTHCASGTNPSCKEELCENMTLPPVIEP